MKTHILTLVCMIAFAQSWAQPDHIPMPYAKRLNDRAVTTYTKFNTNADSVMAAIALLGKAVAADSLYYNAWTNKLGYECQLKHFDEAIKTAQNITRIFPDMHDLLFFMGILQFKTHHDKQAVATFEQLVAIYNRPAKKMNNQDLKTDVINKAIALKLIGKTEEGNSILVKLANDERDPAIKKYIASYINYSKEQIIELMVPGN